ncbi:hypothetical protein [Amycolatopsis cihanbeyliensis]|uniref:hypothetical protein n=1 Tax=Amycolatopsis cihanbeyliensis TaxID=1128664 RepID=UPI001B86C825|nr:hypothetical protein [Amycolatopsis cihanbeyliensis]
MNTGGTDGASQKRHGDETSAGWSTDHVLVRVNLARREDLAGTSLVVRADEADAERWLRLETRRTAVAAARHERGSRAIAHAPRVVTPLFVLRP